MIRLLIVAGVKLYREGLEQVLDGVRDISVVGSVGAVGEASALSRPWP